VSASVWTSLAPTLPGGRASGRPAEIDRAILRTVLYSSLFQAPLTLTQLHRALMDVGVDRAEIRSRLGRAYLAERLEFTGEHVYPSGRGAFVDLQRERRRRTAELLAERRSLLRAVTWLPFVRMVALSGACAHDNATIADVDVFLIARRGRAWTVLLAVMLLNRIAGRGRSLSVNDIVDEDGLGLRDRDLFTAAEIVGMRPLAGRAAYLDFVEANAWVAERYPNFFWMRRDTQVLPAAGAPRWIERLLDLGPAAALEAFARRVLGARLRRAWDGFSGVLLSAERLKLHPLDHGPGLRAAFAEIVDRADANE
jgi:hypothetical protein